MRTTLEIPDDLHRALLALARHGGTSLHATAAALLRRGLATEVVAAPSAARDPETGFPLVRARRPVTPADVAALEDEA